MTDLTPKARLLKVLRKEPVDRPPVICTGGMMNAAIVEIMERTGHTLPRAHFDDRLMTALAEDVTDATGFENLGVPFCMTVEAELLGSEIDPGTLACEPKIRREVFPSVSRVEYQDVRVLAGSGRIQTVVAAAGRLARAHPDLPVIASLTGPVSTTASIVDPMSFLKELRKDPEGAHRALDYVTDLLVEYARLALAAGATAIAIGDPTATGEILGPKMFEAFALRHLNELTDRVHALGAPVILHICGDLKRVRARRASRSRRPARRQRASRCPRAPPCWRPPGARAWPWRPPATAAAPAASAGCGSTRPGGCGAQPGTTRTGPWPARPRCWAIWGWSCPRPWPGCASSARGPRPGWPSPRTSARSGTRRRDSPGSTPEPSCWTRSPATPPGPASGWWWTSAPPRWWPPWWTCGTAGSG
jgi:[methyl-Co(III) methanol-specific corrinoid protein]:coenzyme M methyltransferase